MAEALRHPKTQEAVTRAFAKAGITLSYTDSNSTTISTAQASQGPMRFDEDSTYKQPGQTFAMYQSFSTAQSDHKDIAIPPLMNRWILDPGSNVHVCNSTEFGWKETRKAMQGEIIYAGDNAVDIEA